MKKIIYPGTFDPITNGHLDIINRAVRLFPKIIIAVTDNRSKRSFFSIEQRLTLVSQVLKKYPTVEVKRFEGLLINFVRQEKASVILRGLRTVKDFEYEMQLASMNRRMVHDIETIFLIASENQAFVSSSLVREIAALQGDLSSFVPFEVVEAFDNLKAAFDSN